MVFKCSLFAIYYNYVFNHMVEALEYGFFAVITDFCYYNQFCDEHFCTSIIVPIFDDFLRLNC